MLSVKFGEVLSMMQGVWYIPDIHPVVVTYAMSKANNLCCVDPFACATFRLAREIIT